MKATRRAQPYRKGGLRPPGGALTAMMRGRPAYLPNPSTLADHMMRSRRRRKRR